ncbi:MAG TPA: VWA domain-containing protein [Flavobacteriaceae bacterium]|nr:VWA domain-containing protein [Flavobacteriaceae bacterium]
MIVLEEKTYFWLFWIIPAVILLFLLTRWWMKRAQHKFGNPTALKKLAPDKSRFKPVLKLTLYLLALACLIMALINPKIGSRIETVKREGVDIVFALDVSKSMLAEDMAPNRLEKSKRIINQIIDNLHGDRVGIIGYAGSAFPQLPITTDYASAKLFLNEMNTDMVSSQGTAIADAIHLSLGFFDDETKTGRVLMLITDGEDHEGELEEISKKAAEKDIKIFTVGIGTEKGARIPIKENGVVKYFKKDWNGETVITKMNSKNLKDIAEATDGEYVYGRDIGKVVSKTEEFLAKLEKSELESKEFASFKSQFQWFVGFGILFIILDILVLERKTAWLQRLNLFNENERRDAA